MLELRNVRAGYGDAVVLDGISLVLAANQSLAILGRNGVGKSTLLKLLFGELACRAGSVRFDGREVQAFEATARRALGISYCPQERPVFEDLDGWPEELGDVRTFEDLPKNAQSYVRALEEMSGAPFSVVGVGPGRDQTIVLRDLV